MSNFGLIITIYVVMKEPSGSVFATIKKSRKHCSVKELRGFSFSSKLHLLVHVLETEQTFPSNNSMSPKVFVALGEFLK